jgi:HlyD family secretion protein
MVPVRWMKIVCYVLLSAPLVGVISLYLFGPRRMGCILRVDDHLTISTVFYGPFHDRIPQSGRPATDMLRGDFVTVDIDQMYLSRIALGQSARSTIDNKDYDLEIDEVFPKVVDGRFNVHLCFNDTLPACLPPSIRMTIQLEQPTDKLLLPPGDFQMDTRGDWAFVMEDDGLAVRRKIKLGRYNREYFEVISGLNNGDRVITS